MPAASQIDPLYLNFRLLVLAETQAGRELDVPGFADERILVGIAIVTQYLARLIEDRHRAFRFALAIDDVDKLAVHCDRVGADHQLLGMEAELRVVAERPLVPYTGKSVHHRQHGAGPHRLDRRERTDKRESVGLLVTV